MKRAQVTPLLFFFRGVFFFFSPFHLLFFMLSLVEIFSSRALFVRALSEGHRANRDQKKRRRDAALLPPSLLYFSGFAAIS